MKSLTDVINEAFTARSSAISLFNNSMTLGCWSDVARLYPNCKNINSDDCKQAVLYIVDEIVKWFPLEIDDPEVIAELQQLVLTTVTGNNSGTAIRVGGAMGINKARLSK